MKTLKMLAVAAATAAIIAPAQAQGLSFNIGAVSLYKSNGIDQDSRQEERSRAFRPAIQGGVDYDFGNGFYVGNWNSTGKFGDANIEIDLYGGYAGDITESLSFDVGVARYIFPNQADSNAYEWYASLTFGVATLDYARTFRTRGEDKEARLGLSVSQPLTDVLTLEGGVGFRNRANFDRAYDYSLGVTYDLSSNLTASAMWSGAQTRKVGDAGKARLILGIGMSF